MVGFTEVARKNLITSVNWSRWGSMVWSDYGSSEEKLDYFGKLERPEQHGLVGFTEVARKNSITSVNWSSRSSTVASDRIKPEGIQNKAGKHSE